MPPLFRFATEADIPALLELRLAVDADQERRFGKNRWSTPISERSVARGLRSSRVLVATRKGRIVGALRMETKKPWAVDLRYFTPVARAVYLHDVNVDPSRQRSGVGRQLIERAKAAAREWPVDAIRLDAYDGPAGGGPFTQNADSRKWAAQCIEVFHFSTSSPSLEVRVRAETKMRGAAKDLSHLEWAGATSPWYLFLFDLFELRKVQRWLLGRDH